MDIAIVDQTPHELVVVKPAGLASEHTRDPGADSLVFRLGRQGFTGLRCVHRLDSPACGLMLIARTATAARHYSAEIEKRRWHKWYVARLAVPHRIGALLVGSHKAYLSTEGRSAVVVRSGGKASFLDVVAAAPSPDDTGHSDVLIALHTGRFHQIRVMMANLGAPLAGDTRYGGPASPTMYLEHVILGARPFESDAWKVWTAPPHADRVAWAPALAQAVHERATALLAALRSSA
ncbi:MAG: pseudouridine synthase family protein [Vicinamibacterales bacterium]